MFNDRKRSLATGEFAQLVNCCRMAFAQGNRDVAPLPLSDIDWTAFLGLARRHRVQGLAWRGLHAFQKDLPEQVIQSLSEDARTIARHGMESAAECARLLRAFSSARVTVLFLKGLPLGKLAYGDPFVKMSWDIDMLIEIDQLALAETQLRGLGYALVTPPPCNGGTRLQRWHESRKESVWRKAGTNIHLELHTRLSDNRRLLCGMGANSPRQLVDVAPSLALPTLATDQLFAYLCVHGSSSAWFRLKWLADVAAILDGCDSRQISRLYRRSQELGSARAAAQALLLAQDVFGTRLERRLSRELESDRGNCRLARMAWLQMTRAAEPTEVRLGTSTIHLTQFLLHPGLGFKLSELRRQLGGALGNRI